MERQRCFNYKDLSCRQLHFANPATAAAAILFIILASVNVVFAQPYTMQSLVVTVYNDGAARVEMSFNVDLLNPFVNLTLLGGTYLDVLVTDRDGLPLGYSVYPEGVTVNTLGEEWVKASYTTHDLTSKSGKYWSVQFELPLAAWIVFPTEASIVSMNTVPDAIDTNSGRTMVLMPAGNLSISYVLSIVGTFDYALITISDAENAINGINATGVNVTAAYSLLVQAKDALSTGSYAIAEELGVQAKASALQTNATAVLASLTIIDASNAVIKAETEGRTAGLDEAKVLLSQANLKYSMGEYASALDFAEQAKTKAEASTAPLQTWLLLLAAIAAIGVLAAAAFAIRRIRSVKAVGYVRGKHTVDLESIAEEGRLREEDLAVVRVLAENGGEAFESEVRAKFDLPKTTIWRTAKRLEREGYISIEIVAGQNLLKVKQDFLKENVKKN